MKLQQMLMPITPLRYAMMCAARSAPGSRCRCSRKADELLAAEAMPALMFTLIITPELRCFIAIVRRRHDDAVDAATSPYRHALPLFAAIILFILYALRVEITMMVCRSDARVRRFIRCRHTTSIY